MNLKLFFWVVESRLLTNFHMWSQLGAITRDVCSMYHTRRELQASSIVGRRPVHCTPSLYSYPFSAMALSSILPRVFFSEGIAPQFDGSHGALAMAQACLVVALLVVGCVRAASVTSAAVRYIWRQFLRPGKKLSQYGSWAIVTGGTDGIGREYANQLAKQGAHASAHTV